MGFLQSFSADISNISDRQPGYYWPISQPALYCADRESTRARTSVVKVHMKIITRLVIQPCYLQPDRSGSVAQSSLRRSSWSSDMRFLSAPGLQQHKKVNQDYQNNSCSLCANSHNREYTGNELNRISDRLFATTPTPMNLETATWGFPGRNAEAYGVRRGSPTDAGDGDLNTMLLDNMRQGSVAYDASLPVTLHVSAALARLT